MHEFLLFGQIPSTRHDQVLSILSGVTASQPAAFNEQHYTYAPLKADAANTNARKKPQSANLQLYYHDLYREASADSIYWLRVSQEPEPGNQHVISRSYTMQGLSKDETEVYDDATRFKPINPQQLHIGHHFVHGNVVFRVYRVLVMVNPAGKEISANFPDDKWFELLDESGAYVIEASIRLEDRSNSKLTDAATKELLEVKRLLQGAIDLYVPDRLSLDTRVKSTQITT